MSQRDLTLNSHAFPAERSDSSQESHEEQNTYNVPLFNISSDGFNVNQSNDSGNSVNSPQNPFYSNQNAFPQNQNPFGDPVLRSQSPETAQYTKYNAFYPNSGLSEQLLRGLGDFGLLLGLTPAEYDRYPLEATSRRLSMNLEILNLTHGIPATPVLPDADFSPFGGYPASSFPLHIDEKEPDDYLHNPDPVVDAIYEKNRFIHDLKNMDRRSMGGLIGVIGLAIAAIMIFIVLPVLTYSGVTNHYKPESYEVLSKYKYPILLAIRTSLVDPDTPTEFLTKKSRSGDEWKLVFSDEFAAEGRTFYDGDDQFFTAPDIHYDATKDLEWYDPDAVTTKEGTLSFTMDAFKNHDLFYRSGMVQTWNKMCFTEGNLEFSARLPNYGNVTGLWPGLWTMGNLGRPGYLASTEGVWPYSYESCDAGITANQSSPDGISYLPGQRLNSCTCKGEAHPNPGTGRGAPEIDALEGEISNNLGLASQSLQLAPYDIWYYPDYDFVAIHNSSVTVMNTYTGGPLQQAFSAVTTLNISWYERGDCLHNYQRYGFEYINDNEDGYLQWFVGEQPTLLVLAPAMHPNGNIGWRRLSKEPMSLVMNFGISNSWAYIDWPSLHFPMEMRVSHVRVYQPADKVNIGCDPDDYPTYDYIQQHWNIYQNANLTSFEDGGYKFPKNTLVNGCSA